MPNANAVLLRRKSELTIMYPITATARGGNMWMGSAAERITAARTAIDQKFFLFVAIVQAYKANGMAA